MPFLAQKHYKLSNKDILSWTFDDFKHDWDAPIYIDGVDPSRSYSARQAKALIQKLIAGFRAIGLQKGDCVCIHSFNEVHYPLFFLGLIGAGGIFAGTNPAYTPHELAHTLKTAKVKYVLVAPELLDNILQATKETKISRDKIIIFNPKGEPAPKGYLQWNDLLKHGEKDWVRFDDYETAYQTGAARLFSSGTTGLPKAAELSHLNLIAQQMLVYEAYPRQWRPRKVYNLPFFHAATAPNIFCGPLREGHPSYIFRRFDLQQWLEAIEKYEITDVVAVPPLIIGAINSPFGKRYDLSRSTRMATVGAAPLDVGSQARFQKLLGQNAPITQVWGMTETSCVATRFSWEERDDTGSIGRPIPNLDVKLVDEDGKDITGYDVRGEFCVRGPTVIKGYFDNPEANARDWDKDNYFHTGDIVYIDGKTGLYYIVDRKKELIKVRGNQVAPPELEGVLLSHPEIVDCAVIGVPDHIRDEDELPRGYIVRKNPKGNKPSEEEIQKWMTKHLASFKRLEGGIVFMDAIPKNASGKILKRILREEAKKNAAPAKRSHGAKL